MSTMPASSYVVRQGDHVSRIAHGFGFSDYRTIWNHPENSSLKDERGNPNVLCPGDGVFIPEREIKDYGCATEQKHSFRARLPKLRLVLVLADEQGKPVGRLPCELHVENDRLALATEPNGQISRAIRPCDRDARLYFRSGSGQGEFGEQLAIRIGDLDPVETLSGQVARLTNLGYFLGDADEPDGEHVTSAIEEFQCDHPPLKIDGACGPATQSKLREVHGS